MSARAGFHFALDRARTAVPHAAAFALRDRAAVGEAAGPRRPDVR